MFSTLGDILSTLGISLSTPGGVQHTRDILSTPGGVQYSGVL